MNHITQASPAAALQLTVPLLIWGSHDNTLDLTQLMRQLDDPAGRQPERLMSDVFDLARRANRIPMEDQSRALLLDCAGRCQQFLLVQYRAARRQIGMAASSNDGQSERLLRLTEELGFGYKRLLLSQIETFAPVEQQAVTLRGAITALSQQFLLCLDLRRARSKSLWGEFHRLFRHAERIKVENRQFREVDGAAGTNLHGLYLRTVLTFAADPYALPANEHWLLQSYLARWCSLVRLESAMQPPSFSQSSRMAVDLRGLEIGPLLKQVQQHRFQLAAGEQSVQALGFEAQVSTDQALRLLDHLLERWTQKRQRGAERHACQTTVTLTVGFMSIYRCLRGSVTGQQEASTQLQFDAVMENESDGGAALRLPTDYRGTLPAVGELVLLAKRGGFDPVRPMLGWVRWQQRSPRDEISFGMEYLHSTTQPVELDQFDGSTLSASQRPALLLVRAPGESLPFSLIAQPHIYRSDRTVRLAFVQRIETQQAVAGRMIARSGGCDHFQLEGDLDVDSTLPDEVIEIDYDPFPFNLGSLS